ncbi:TPA: glutamine synthetase [Candidatus Poribacteria bacterium]|jgi:glutamine synthetase|nr:glutamine synthetase [Candidatus Poribacteria bacterium]HIA70455.1 glutamine synthetase [Candidatus Poribacteria bacterium]HIB88289.1 glutamine synthetase [Candidatus Poribacteria bacterium]HIB99827.1 glutamine synthetase [Candidatus Poribacteria bacterium]HIN30698.1 glutamine synthetase [Candidatus Poribacteria bacterium]
MLEQIKRTFREKGIHKVKLGGFDIDGVLRGKYVSVDKFLSAAEKGLGFCDVVFNWDSDDELYGTPAKLTGEGYPDLLAKIDLSTFRQIPWEPDTAFFILDFFCDQETPFPLCPRHLLRTVIGQANEMGFQPFASVEYEYFLFKETADSLMEKGFKNLTPMSPGAFGYSVLRASAAAEFVHTVVDSMAEYDVTLEGIHTETGPGAYETAIKYDMALKSADKAGLFKTGVKEICTRQGLVATFMAKWSPDYPGCSGHLHQSLWNLDAEKNCFSDTDDSLGMSDTMKHYIGGQKQLMPEMMALICPTVNSYKRIVPGSWAPVNASWGIENRTAAIRAIPGQDAKSTRVEYRLAGSDAHPHIAIAASLAAGLYGIRYQIDPEDPLTANAYEADENRFESLPQSLSEAINRLDQSDTFREILGSDFVDHYLMTRRWEYDNFSKAVTDWERQRYFEII